MNDDMIQIFDPIYNVNALRDSGTKKNSKAKMANYKYNFALQNKLKKKTECWLCPYFGINCNPINKCKKEIEAERKRKNYAAKREKNL